MRCFVPNCESSFHKGDDMSFFKFPRDPKMRQKWIDAVKVDESLITKSSTVCSRHFKKSDFKNPNSNRRILYSFAVPEVKIRFHADTDDDLVSLFPKDPNEYKNTITFETFKGIPTQKDKLENYSKEIYHMVFLKYLKQNMNIITHSKEHPDIVNKLCTELNRIDGRASQFYWIKLMRSWISHVKDKVIRKHSKITPEDDELLNLINNKKASEELTDSEINFIIDYLEFSQNSLETWNAISLELNSMGERKFNSEKWRMKFNKFCLRTKRKKRILDLFEDKLSDIQSYLTETDNKTIKFIEDTNYIPHCNDKENNVQCRICLITKDMIFYNIFTESLNGKTYAEKIQLCANIEKLDENSDLPHHICEKCIILLENAYKFKTLCEESDLKLRKNNELQEIIEKNHNSLISKNIKDEENFKNLFDINYEIIDNDFQIELYENDKCNENNEVEIIEEMPKNEIHILEGVQNDTEQVLINDDNHKNYNFGEINEENCVFSFETESEIDDGLSSPQPTPSSESSNSQTIKAGAEQSSEIEESVVKESVKTTNSKSGPIARCSWSEIQRCTMCKKAFYDKKTLTKHLKTHIKDDNYPCKICKKVFQTSFSLTIHMRCHTGERPYVCEICDKTYTQPGELACHYKTHSAMDNFNCKECEYQAKTVTELKIHEILHTKIRPYVCNKCSLEFLVKSEFIEHSCRRAKKRHLTSFKTWSAIITHNSIHSDNKEYKCFECSYCTNTKSNLKIHNRIHTKIKPYSCDKCSLKFSTASNRSKHKKNIHEKNKFHKCTTCNKSFFSKDSLIKHMITHTGLKPYKCPECPLSYAWYYGLTKHVKTQHGVIKVPKPKFYLDQISS